MTIDISGQDSRLTLQDGIFNQLTINASNNSDLTASASTVKNVIVNSQTGSSVDLGIVNNANITQPDACPVDSSASVDIEGVSSGSMYYNGNKIDAETYDTNCGSVVINGDY